MNWHILTIIDVEMKCLIPLLRMELNGFGFRPEDFERHVGILKSKLKQLEHQAFSLVGHPFCLSSPNDVAKVVNKVVECGLIGKIYNVVWK